MITNYDSLGFRYCISCNLSHIDGNFCDNCEDLALDEWAVSFGLSIKKFVLRKEIESLQDTIENGLRAWEPAWNALDRLVEITNNLINYKNFT
jgi:YD repeat-containing protein